MEKKNRLKLSAIFKTKIVEKAIKKAETSQDRVMRNITKKYLSILAFSLLFGLAGYSQYSISGYINAPEKGKTVYLSLLRYNEENAIYPEQVLLSTKTDSTGYFEITGKLLSEENMLYRIHCNLDENSEGFDFQESGEEKNYHNFIFSNSDTLFFPMENNGWFSNPRNTNSADRHWRMSINYELSLLRELSENQNTDAISQAKNNYLDEFKRYCSDSLPDPLVRLLAFSHIKRKISELIPDFKNDPDFYNDILEKLNEYYSGTSYYIQFKEEISRLSVSIIQQRYLFQKRLTLIMGFIILVLIAINLILFRMLHVRTRNGNRETIAVLTARE